MNKRIWFLSVSTALIVALCLTILYSKEQGAKSIEHRAKGKEQRAQRSTLHPLRSTLRVGSWVKYHITRSQKRGAGLQKIWESNIKITSLGPASVEAKDKKREIEHRIWLELVVNEGKSHQKIIRFLVDEQGRSVPERLVIKHGSLPAAEIDLVLWAAKANLKPEQLFNDFMQNYLFLIGPLSQIHTREEEIGTETVRLSVNYRETSIKSTKFKVTNLPPHHIEKRWYAVPTKRKWDRVPFSGLVKIVSQEDLYHTRVILKAYDQIGGKTLITEEPVVLDFKEKK